MVCTHKQKDKYLIGKNRETGSRHPTELGLCMARTLGELQSIPLASPDRGSWLRVVGRDRIVDIYQDARLISSVLSRESDKRSRRATSTTGNRYLGAAEVELSATIALGDVQRDVLCPDEVLASGKTFGEGETDARQVLRGPGDRSTTVGDRADLVDFEPDISGWDPPCGSTAWSFGEIYIQNPRVIQCRRIAGNIEANRGTCRDGHCCGRAVHRRVIASNVA